MLTFDRLREVLTPGADPFYDPADDRSIRNAARIIVLARITVVVSIGLLVLFSPEEYGKHPAAVAVVLVVALAYAVALLGREQLEMRHHRTAVLVTLSDAILAFSLLLLTGGISSPTVTVLVLVVVAAASRHTTLGTLFLTCAVAGAYAVLALASRGDPIATDATVLGLWWPLYLILTAVMATSMSVVAEHQRANALVARITAQEEHAAATEERDLRQRLLRSYRTQQDGLRVILHEFRTPIVSLSALGEALVDQDKPLSPSDHEATLRIANEHIRHIDEMLQALGDVAISWRPAFSSGRIRNVDMVALAESAGHAAGVRPPRLRIELDGSESNARLDAQATRRVLTNLIENAGRHSGDLPVDVRIAITDQQVEMRVLDRGPGVPEESLEHLSGMYTGGDNPGAAGLGLWIVQQIVDATGGTLRFRPRDGGGLAATVTLPVESPLEAAAL